MASMQKSVFSGWYLEEERKRCPYFKVDLATVMAEMFKIGDRNKDDVLTR